MPPSKTIRHIGKKSNVYGSIFVMPALFAQICLENPQAEVIVPQKGALAEPMLLLQKKQGRYKKEVLEFFHSDIFVSMMDGENAYGDTKGVVTLTYEDSFGNAYTKEYDFETSIVKMPDNTEAIQSQEPKSASQWWISVAVVAGFLLLMGCTGAAYWLGRKKR